MQFGLRLRHLLHDAVRLRLLRPGQRVAVPNRLVESLLTQTLIIHVIRTNRVPFVQNRASRPLIATTVALMAVGASLPFSPLGPVLGFTPLPLSYSPVLAAILLACVVLT